MLSKKELRSRANSDSCLRGGCVSAWKGPRTRIHSGFHQVRVTEIPRLNDAFRTTFRGGRILLTASVVELPEMVKAAAAGGPLTLPHTKSFTAATAFPSGTSCRAAHRHHLSARRATEFSRLIGRMNAIKLFLGLDGRGHAVANPLMQINAQSLVGRNVLQRNEQRGDRP